MANYLLKLCLGALAGWLVALTYERWPTIETGPAFPAVSAADSFHRPTPASILTDPCETPSDEPADQSGRSRRATKPIAIDPKRSADNLIRSSRFGLPSRDNLRVFNDFVLSYDRRLRSPIWVLEHLTPDKLDSSNASRKRSRFVEDRDLHEYFRAELKDFKGSELSRGHMAAAANHKLTQDDMDQTFVLSNVSPQDRRMNSGGWAQLESYARFLAKRNKNLYVVTGPLYLPRREADGHLYVSYRVIGENFVGVPTHYFKVLLAETDEGRLALEAFMMPNDPQVTKRVNLDAHRVLVGELAVIERASGVIFFDALQRDKVEAPTQVHPEFGKNLERSKTGPAELD